MYDFPASAIDPEAVPAPGVCAICGEAINGDARTLHAHGKAFPAHPSCADAAEDEAGDAND